MVRDYQHRLIVEEWDIEEQKTVVLVNRVYKTNRNAWKQAERWTGMGGWCHRRARVIPEFTPEAIARQALVARLRGEDFTPSR